MEAITLTICYEDETIPIRNELFSRITSYREELSLLSEIKAEIDENNKSLQKYVVNALRSIQHQDDAVGTASDLYWMCTEIKPSAIADGLGITTHEMLKVIHGRDSWHYGCDCCGARIPLSSRTHRLELEKDKNSGIGLICGDCKERMRDALQEKYQMEEQHEQLIIKQLRSMPYQQYLQTDHWKDTRATALRRARYACQLCNAKNTILDVHHRTYENRGCEHAGDLMVLCRECHSKFHDKVG